MTMRNKENEQVQRQPKQQLKSSYKHTHVSLLGTLCWLGFGWEDWSAKSGEKTRMKHGANLIKYGGLSAHVILSNVRENQLCLVSN
ncbi:hypothetical protein EUGRSUZ_H04935 [Eucalyptus grandis]|uniref:Uncharacterized protein n=2 Tax=Eucalyptus grandis TaxID=71139 RepID=A0ACC3JYL1_EUCGR|nr:hypothetical protein EUGRSUZ_H04935 [Eucalyptus grandis]